LSCCFMSDLDIQQTSPSLLTKGSNLSVSLGVTQFTTNLDVNSATFSRAA
jgi:hypothetical protein